MLTGNATSSTDPVSCRKHYTGSTADPVVSVVLRSGAEVPLMPCVTRGSKCLVKLEEQWRETDFGTGAEGE